MDETRRQLLLDDGRPCCQKLLRITCELTCGAEISLSFSQVARFFLGGGGLWNLRETVFVGLNPCCDFRCGETEIIFFVCCQTRIYSLVILSFLFPESGGDCLRE